MKTKLEILSEATGMSIEDLQFKNEVQCVRPSEAIEAMEQCCKQQPTGQKTKEEILIEALNIRCKYENSKEMDYLTHLAIMDAMDAYATQQVDAATANHDQEMVEFAKYCYTNWKVLETYQSMLTKFRQSK